VRLLIFHVRHPVRDPVHHVPVVLFQPRLALVGHGVPSCPHPAGARPPMQMAHDGAPGEPTIRKTAGRPAARGRGYFAHKTLRRLLRPCRHRPRRRAAKPRDEIPPSHWITSSAVASSASGMLSPSVLAVLRLMTSSNFVGCITGNSAGFTPLSIRATY
jgi:hypothetical protein